MQENEFSSQDQGDYQPNKRLKLSHEVLPDQKEMDVGVADFVYSDGTPFTAAFKQRYTDFLVNEILPNGQILHLKKTNLPKQWKLRGQQDQLTEISDTVNGKQPPANESEPSGKEGESNGLVTSEASDSEALKPELGGGQISSEDKAVLVEYFNAEAVEELLELHTAILANPAKKPKDHPTVRTSFTSDRTVRAQIHQDIRRIFNNRIDSSTDQSGMLVLTAAYASNRSDGQRAQNSKPQLRGKMSWLDRGGEYLHFTLYKENKDTMEVISYISKQLKTTPKTFQFAGTKDRRAVTVQRASAYRIEAGRLLGLNKVLHGSALGDFDYKHDKLQLGDLDGNEFTITLRDCQFPGTEHLTPTELLNHARSIVTPAMQSLATNGFLNYYGLQRFGTYATRTDVIGLHLLRSDFRPAVDAILHYTPSALAAAQDSSLPSPTANPVPAPSTIGSDDINRALSIHSFRTTSDLQHALSTLPRKFSAESQILRSLAKNPSDQLGAILAIQRNLRLMYVHAYQSRIWNMAVAHRWKLFGAKVVEGDLILLSDHPVDTMDVPEEVDELGEPVISAAATDPTASRSADDMYVRARPLSAAEAVSGEYTIHDIVLPLPGYDIIYPPNALGEFYNKYMASEDGGGLDYKDMRRKQRDFSLSGSYRKILGRVGQEWEVDVKSYSQATEKFVMTDLELLKGGKDAGKSGGGNGNHLHDKKEASKRDEDDEPRDAEARSKKRESKEDAHTIQKQDPSSGHSTQTLPAGGRPTACDSEATGDKIAVILKFQLGSSQYATMALRELSRGGVREYKPEFSGGR